MIDVLRCFRECFTYTMTTHNCPQVAIYLHAIKIFRKDGYVYIKLMSHKYKLKENI